MLCFTHLKELFYECFNTLIATFRKLFCWIKWYSFKPQVVQLSRAFSASPGLNQLLGNFFATLIQILSFREKPAGAEKGTTDSQLLFNELREMDAITIINRNLQLFIFALARSVGLSRTLSSLLP